MHALVGTQRGRVHPVLLSHCNSENSFAAEGKRANFGRASFVLNVNTADERESSLFLQKLNVN